MSSDKSVRVILPPTLLQDLGMRFPREGSKRKYRYGLYRCGYCGTEFKIRTSSIKSGATRSCGCVKGVNHGLSNHRLYSIWANVRERCYTPSHSYYYIYGGRGITVCEEWKDTPTQFIEDMYPSFVEGLTLDRIDNDKGYSKENCRWATASEQAINRGIKKNNTSGFNGVSYHKGMQRFTSSICINYKQIHIGYYDSAVEAAIARNNYIIENALPHKLNIIPEE